MIPGASIDNELPDTAEPMVPVDPIEAAECLLLDAGSSLIFLFLSVDSLLPGLLLLIASKLVAAPRPLSIVVLLRADPGDADACCSGGSLKSTDVLLPLKYPVSKESVDDGGLRVWFSGVAVPWLIMV